MISREEYIETAGNVVAATFDSYHVTATARDGRALIVPMSYQVNEETFHRPFELAKGEPGENQAEIDRVIAAAIAKGQDPGIVDEESLRKLMEQRNIGSDCSRFAFSSCVNLFRALGLGPYSASVYWAGDEVREVHAARESWQVVLDESGNPRDLMMEEKEILENADQISVKWICDTFSKLKPAFIISSARMSDERNAVEVDPVDVLPGDLIVFSKPDSPKVTHVGSIAEVETMRDEALIRFAHSWNTRHFDAGLRMDEVVIGDGEVEWSHPDLGDPARYSAFGFRRPLPLDNLLKNL